MDIRFAYNGHLYGYGSYRQQGHFESDDDDHIAVQPDILRTTILHQCMEATASRYGQYGYACGYKHWCVFPFQRVQHLLRSCGMEQIWDRMAYVLRCVGYDYHLCPDR